MQRARDRSENSLECENHSPSKRTKVPLNESWFLSTFSNHDIALQFIIIHFKQLTDMYVYFHLGQKNFQGAYIEGH